MSNERNTALELEKMEYEQAAARYQSIYQSAWSNFSYLTAVAAGIIAFGSKGFPLYVVITLAALPLLFWYAAVFEPANVYGDDVIRRLAKIEDNLNRKYAVELRHFTIYAARRERVERWLSVRLIVRVVASLLILGLIFLLIFGRGLKGDDKPETVALAPTEKPLAVQVVRGEEAQRLSQENEQLRRSLDEFRHSLESISADLKNIKARQK